MKASADYKRKWRDEALCREIELMKIGRDEEAYTKQRQISGDNLLKSAPLVKLSGPENFLFSRQVRLRCKHNYMHNEANREAENTSFRHRLHQGD